MNKIKSISTKGMSLILAILTFLGCFSCLSGFIKPIQVNAETLKNSFPCVLFAYTTTGKMKYVYGEKAGDYVKVMYAANGKRDNPTNCRYAYCMEPGVPLDFTNTLISTNSSTWNKLSADQKNAISAVCNFGISGFVKNEYSAKDNKAYVFKDWGGTPNGSYSQLKKAFPNATDDQFYVATQLLVWEIVNGFRNPKTFYTNDPSNRPSGAVCYLYQVCGTNKDKPQNPGVYSVYYHILNRLQAFAKEPSVAYNSKTNYNYKSGSTIKNTLTTANTNMTINLPVVSEDDTYIYCQKTINDTNKVLSYYDFSDGIASQSIDGVNDALTFSKNGNNMTIKLKLKKSSADPDGKIEFSRIINNAMYFNSVGSKSTTSYFSSLTADADGKNYQDLITGECDLSKNLDLQIYVTHQLADKSMLDLRIKKSIASNTEVWESILTQANGEQEIDGDVNDPDLLAGWYFSVKVTSGKYSGKYYKLGPTDERGYTKNTLAEAIGVKHLPGEDISFEITELGLDVGVPNQYFEPNSLKPYKGEYTIRASIDYDPDNNNTLNYVTFANIWTTTIAVRKTSVDTSENNDTSAGYYFRVWDSNMENILDTIGPTKANGDYVYNANPSIWAERSKRFEAGIYYVEELGLKNDDGSYYIPEHYTPEAEIVTDDGRYLHEIVVSPENLKEVPYAYGNNSTYKNYLTITDDWYNNINGKLQIKKVDADNNKPLAGVSFAIFESDPSALSLDNILSLVEKYNSNSTEQTGILDVITTNEEGIAVTSDGKVFNFAKGKNYYVKEISTVEGWQLSNDTYIICAEPFETNECYDKDNLVCSISLTNSVANDHTVKVQKTTEDNLPLNGWQIQLFGTSVNGTKYNQTKTTDAFGNATFSNLACGSYTIREINLPENVVINGPSSYNFTITESFEKERVFTFNNALKKWHATVTKVDKETTVSQGDATLSGAIYGLYCKGNLEATYTTDENGSFTTAYYPCGDGWTIRELTPSAGYLLDETEYDVGAEGKKYNVSKNNISLTVTEEISKGNIKITKSAATNTSSKKENGAEFKIYLKSAGSYEDAKDAERDIITTNEDGIAVSKMLPYGVYTVHQTRSWETHKSVDDFDVTISRNNQTYAFSLINPAKTATLEIVKKDTETGKVIALSGFGFKIYDLTDKAYVSYKDASGEKIDTFYTNNDGKITLPVKLAYGNYQLIEVQAGIGYVKDSTPIDFTINKNTINNDIVVIEKSNIAQKAILTIEKTGDGFTSVNVSDTATPIYTPVYGKTKLRGAEFDIIANEDIYTADGTLRCAKNKVIATITTDDNGVAKTPELYLGSYRIVETKAPVGYVLNSSPVNVNLEYSDQKTKVNYSQICVNNTRKRVEIDLQKELEKNDVFGIGDNDEILSISFGLYANENIVAADGSTIPVDGLIEIGYVDKDGKLAFSADLPFGKYYVKELTTDSHYIIDNKKYEFEFNYDDSDKEILDLSLTDSPIINKLKYVGNISGKKVDENGNPLAGAVIALFPANPASFTKENAFVTCVSDSNGYFSFKNIPIGSYIVKEIEAPFGYSISNKSYNVDVTHDSQSEIVLLDIENSRITGNLKIVKLSEDNIVSGITFTVVSSTGVTYTCQTDDKGIAILDELPIYNGTEKITYVITETSVPGRYVVPVSQNVVLSENEYSTATFSNVLKKGDLVITKYAEDNQISDLSFVVKGSNGSEYFGKTNEAGQLVFKDLPVYDSNNGFITYTVYEDNVPIKYITPATQSATLIFGEAIKLNFTNNYKKGNILIKKESEDQDIANKEFAIKGSDGSEYSGKTNDLGQLLFENLNMYDKGSNLITYTIYENNVPAKYIVPVEQSVSISEIGKTELVTFENVLKKGNIIINKTSEDNDISNKEFVIKGSDGSEYKGSTNKAGIIEFKNLKIYDYDSNIISYVVYEDNTPVKYVVPDEQTVTLSNGENTNLSFVNNLKKGDIVIRKEAEDNDISGRDFVVKGSDGSEYKGSTDENGIVIFKNLKVYDYDNNIITYTVYEDNIPVKYISPQPQSTNVKTDTETELVFVNKLKHTKLTIQKEAEDNEVSNREFVVKGSNGSEYKGVTNEDGILVFDNLLIYDYDNSLIKYTVYEDNVPVKYIVPDEQDTTLETSEGSTLTFINKFKRSALTITKESEDKDISNKEFVVKGSDGSEYKGVTNENGIVEFKELLIYDKNSKLIEYTVYEDNVPIKYIVPNAQKTILAVEKTTELTFINNLKKGNLIIQKESEDNDISNKDFVIKGSDGSEYKGSTNENGVIKFKNLNIYNYNSEIITYTVYEDNVPVKYIVPDEQSTVLDSNEDKTLTFKNIVKKTKIILNKKSEDNDISNKHFVVKGSNGTEYKASTNDAGTIIFDNLAIYDYNNNLITYSIYEDNVPIKYVVPAEQNITLEFNKDSVLTFVNKFKRSSLTIVKESEDNDIAGKEFVVKDSLGNTYSGKTNADGVLEFLNLLVYNSNNELVTYTVYEDNVPVKYVVPEKQTTSLDEKDTTSLTFINNLKKGNIIINKESEDRDISNKEFVVKGSDGSKYKGVTNENGVVKFENLNVYNHNNELIVYTVYEDNVPVKYVIPEEQSSCIKYNEDTVFTFNNNLKKTRLIIQKESEDNLVSGRDFVVKGSDGSEYKDTTDSNGCIVFDNLSIYDYDCNLIEYVIYEDNVPVRYVVPAEQNTTLEVDRDTSLTFINKTKLGSIVIQKESEDNDIANKEFVVKDSLGNTFTGKTDESGIVRFDDLPVYDSDDNMITYTVYEDNVPIKYVVPEEQATTLKPFDEVCLTFKNNLKKASIKINKNSDDNDIGDKEFVVKGSDGSEYKGLTDEKGIIIFENLNVYNYDNEKIKYTIYEDNVPIKYLIPPTQETELEWNLVSELTFVNTTKTGDLFIKKTDIITSEGLPNCLIAIKDTNGNIVVQGYTDENGEITFKELPYGKYTYQEIEAPEGYVIDTTPCEFEITEDGSIIKGELQNEKITGSITITKTDIVTSEGLPNCLIVIKDSDGNIVVQGRTDKDGNITFNELPYGKYTYQEVEAPEGYILDTTPCEFEIKEDGEIIKANMTNKKQEPNTPFQTGQNSTTTACAAILLLVSISLFLTCYYASRKKENK